MTNDVVWAFLFGYAVATVSDLIYIVRRYHLVDRRTQQDD